MVQKECRTLTDKIFNGILIIMKNPVTAITNAVLNILNLLVVVLVVVGRGCSATGKHG